MRPALRTFTLSLTHYAVEIALARLLPALAVGLVAMAHELHTESAKAESVRRMGQ